MVYIHYSLKRMLKNYLSTKLNGLLKDRRTFIFSLCQNILIAINHMTFTLSNAHFFLIFLTLILKSESGILFLL